MKKGFTLVESLVAISVLLLAITGPMTLASKVIRDSVISQDQITGFYLAQEGLEYVRNQRESNFLSGQNWLKDLEQCFGNGCIIDVPNDTIITANSYNECPLNNTIKYEIGGDYYNYDNGDCSIFKRVVKITKINLGGADDEAKIECMVEWEDKSGTKLIHLEEHIFNWR